MGPRTASDAGRARAGIDPSGAVVAAEVPNAATNDGPPPVIEPSRAAIAVGSCEPGAERKRPVYLDYQATTPLDNRVWDAMAPYFGGRFGNPHSVDHGYGWEAAEAVREARRRVASFIGADDDEIVFTSGATESCNLALRGVAAAGEGCRRTVGTEVRGGRSEIGRAGARHRIVTVATEHPAVLETVRDLGRGGHEIEIVPVGRDGLVDMEHLARAVDERTLVVSVMAANNEIGVIQPLAEIGALCREAGALFHTDATQAGGRMSVSVDEWGVDLLSLSAHKMYGPKGVGALYVRDGTAIRAVTTGGDQEGGLRPGTLPTALVAGFGVACEIAESEGPADMRRMAAQTRRLREAVTGLCPEARLFGHVDRRIPGNLCLGFPDIDAGAVIRGLSQRVAISTGAACSSATAEPSRVLLALGLEPEVASTGVRVSLGRFTTDHELEVASAAFSDFILDHVYY